MQNSTNQVFLIRKWTNGSLFDRILLQKMQRNAKNALDLLLLGEPLFMGHTVVLLSAMIEMSKVLAEMGRGLQAGLARAKSFSSI